MQITGLETNINFLIDLAAHPEFQEGNVHTGFIDEHFETLFPPIEIKDEELCKAAIALVLNESQVFGSNAGKNDPFNAAQNARLNYSLIRSYNLKGNDKGEFYKFLIFKREYGELNEEYLSSI